jgi:hypothetical protein
MAVEPAETAASTMPARSFSLVRHDRHSPRIDTPLAWAPPAAPVILDSTDSAGPGRPLSR